MRITREYRAIRALDPRDVRRSRRRVAESGRIKSCRVPVALVRGARRFPPAAGQEHSGRLSHRLAAPFISAAQKMRIARTRVDRTRARSRARERNLRYGFRGH